MVIARSRFFHPHPDNRLLFCLPLNTAFFIIQKQIKDFQMLKCQIYETQCFKMTSQFDVQPVCGPHGSVFYLSHRLLLGL